MKTTLTIWTILLAVAFCSCDTSKSTDQKAGQESTNSTIQQGKNSTLDSKKTTSKKSQTKFRMVNNSDFPFDTHFPDKWDNTVELKTYTVISKKPAVANEKLTRVIKIDAKIGRQKFDKVKGEMAVTPPKYRDEARKYLEKLKASSENLTIVDSGAETFGGQNARLLHSKFKRKSDQLEVESRAIIGASKQMTYIMSYSYPAGEFNEEDENIWNTAVKNFKFRDL